VIPHPELAWVLCDDRRSWSHEGFQPFTLSG
jgi:hypothetical protein